MGLNIKNEEAHQLVAELAKLTGESMTAAVTEADPFPAAVSTIVPVRRS